MKMILTETPGLVLPASRLLQDLNIGSIMGTVEPVLRIHTGGDCYSPIMVSGLDDAASDDGDDNA
jgi:hypothetical protein